MSSYAIITYKKLLYSSMSNVEGGFNITTGIYTAGYTETESVSELGQLDGPLLRQHFMLN